MSEASHQQEESAESVSVSDEAIVRMLRDKDEAGLHALLDRHGEATRATLTSRLPGREDLIEQAIVAAAFQMWERPQGIDLASGKLRSYFYTIVRNAVRKLLRKERGERMLLAQLGHHDDAGQLSERQKGLVADLRLAVAKLAPLQQAIVRADLAEGRSAPAEPIMRAFGTSANSIYVSRAKAYKRLRKLLERMERESGKEKGDE